MCSQAKSVSNYLKFYEGEIHGKRVKYKHVRKNIEIVLLRFLHDFLVFTHFSNSN